MATRQRSHTEHGSDSEGALLLVGRFAKAHGLRGEVKVIPESDDPARLRDLETVYVGPDSQDTAPYAVESLRLQQTKHGATIILKLEGVESPEQADALRQQFVFARVEDLPPLEEDEVYLHDLVGLSVVTEAEEEVGSISDVLEMPGHYVYVVSRPGKPDAWIPAVDEFVVDIDLDAERMVIRPIEGLLD